MEEEKIKHLEFIQKIITRMNTNSFQIKEWAVALVTAILALYASTKNKTIPEHLYNPPFGANISRYPNFTS